MKLPRTRRLTLRSDFQRVRREGESVKGQHLVLGYLPDDSITEPFRLGIITTKKLGNAVTRSRVRRRIRGIINRLGERISPGHLLVIIARYSAATANSAQLEKEFKWLLHRSKLIEKGADAS